MARKNPLGTIKDVAIGTAKGGVDLGLAVAGQVATKATDTVTSLIPGRKTPAPAPAPDLESAVPATVSRKSQGDPMSPAKVTPIKSAPAKKAAAKKAAPQVAEVSADKPVNVTKELGLDAAPVAKPAPAAKADRADKPLTSIDAAADVSHVDATPADIAPAVKKAAAKKAPAKKAAAKKAPAKKAPAKKAPAKKTAASSPGDKLPPRTS